MFGLSWGQIIIIVLVGVFVLGPERIPTAVSAVLTGARKVRTMASGAQAELVRELGPEIADLRRQIAELQALRQLPELRQLLDLDPGRLLGGNLLGGQELPGGAGLVGGSTNPPDEQRGDPSPG